MAPSALTVTSATRSAVVLTWTAGSAPPLKFIVERKGIGSAWPVPATPPVAGAPLTPAVVATVDAAAVTDSKIDAFATYVYRVRTVGADNTLSVPTNEVTVGPPPVGFNSVVAAPKAMHDVDPSSFGNQLSMTFDANGDPVIAYYSYDLNHDGDPTDNEFRFVTWNRARYRWNAAVHVDDVGNITRGGSRVPLSLARDASTGRFGLAYIAAEHELRFAWSADSGTTWKHATVPDPGATDVMISTPSLVMGGGRVHLAYFLGGAGVRYRTGAADSVGTWTLATAPLLAGATEPHSEGVNMMLDAAGKPALLYLMAAADYNVVMGFWRPGASGAVKVTDTENHQTDDPAAHATIVGNTIAVAFYANRDAHYFENHHIWFVRSTDNGATWQPPVSVADDGGNSMGSPLSVTIDHAGHYAMVAEHAGGNDDGTKCGQPKLMRSADGRAWTTCAPDTKGAPQTSDATFPVVAFAGNDKLYVVFKARGTAPGLAPGVVLWRER